MQQEIVLALLAKEPSYGYELRGRVEEALGPLAADFNAGRLYVTLGRLEQAGLITVTDTASATERDRKFYDLTPSGRDRLAEWVAHVSWPRPDLADFHLKLVVAASARLADPIDLLDAHRRELLRRLTEAQRSALAEPAHSLTALLLEGVILRIEADLTWIQVCETSWTDRR